MTGKPISDDSRGTLACSFDVVGKRAGVVFLGDDEWLTPSGLAESLRAALLGDESLQRATRSGGPALAMAAYEAAGKALPEPAWALTVGGAVQRGLPTAARGTLTARTRLRTGIVEAQFGGDFAAFFAARLDALLVYGRSTQPVVLVCTPPDPGAAPKVEVVQAPGGFERQGLSEREQSLRREFGEGAAMLIVGPAADLGLPMANVASISPPSSGAAPSFVGRGGMGLSLREAGVVAVVVHALTMGERQEDWAGSESLRQRLLKSPRLLARDVGGTLELGALREPPPGSRSRPSASLPTTGAATKHGCRGCPTPCGWMFDQPDGEVGAAGAKDRAKTRTGGRFAALQGALGEADGGLGFLAECNELGLDARTCALVMNRLRGEGQRFEGPRDLMDRGSPAFQLAMALHAGSDVEPAASSHGADLAAQVGVYCSARGPEPVRSLSVLGLGSIDPLEMVAPMPWRGEAHWDAGVLAYWHECFAAAIDVSGFCAFSAAGLIADGVMDVGELARLVAPRDGWAGDGHAGEGETGRAMLAAGAEHVERHRRLGEAADREERSDPAWERALDGYDTARACGFMEFEAAEDALPRRMSPAKETSPEVTRSPSPESHHGSVRLTVSGLLAARLGAESGSGGGGGGSSLQMDCELPGPGADLRSLLRSLIDARPSVGPWLLGPDGRVIPAAISGGRRLAPDALLIPGTEIELILAIPGG